MSQNYVIKVLWSLPGFFATGKKAGLLFSSDEDRCTILRDPHMWWGWSIKEIFDLRRELIWGILPPWNALPQKLEGDYLWTLMSSSPLKVACTFEKDLRPIYHIRRLPVGGSIGKLIDLKIIDNYALNSLIKRITETQNLGASEGIITLYEAGIDVYKISEFLSAGLLGTWERRRIIPTKSAIVIVDINVSNYLLSKIIKYSSIDCFEVYYSRYLDTTYAVLIMPGPWEHEQIKAVYLAGDWRVESQRETLREKPVFPGQIGGSYFPGRFAITEYLHKRRRQGKVLLFREIEDRDSIAVGAWQVRESLRRALEKEPQCYESLKGAVKDVLNSLNMPSKLWHQNSQLLSKSGCQTTLNPSKKLQEF